MMLRHHGDHDTGENKAWELLAASNPAVVCARAGVEFDPGAGTYRVPSFGQDSPSTPSSG